MDLQSVPRGTVLCEEHPSYEAVRQLYVPSLTWRRGRRLTDGDGFYVTKEAAAVESGIYSFCRR